MVAMFNTVLNHHSSFLPGPFGDPGPNLPGEKGETGEAGKSGMEGLSGFPGATGDEGLPGPPGNSTPGEPGATGKLTRVPSRIYRLGEKSQEGEGHELPRGAGGMPPPPKCFLNEYALGCNLVHFETSTILGYFWG